MLQGEAGCACDLQAPMCSDLSLCRSVSAALASGRRSGGILCDLPPKGGGGGRAGGGGGAPERFKRDPRDLRLVRRVIEVRFDMRRLWDRGLEPQVLSLSGSLGARSSLELSAKYIRLRL